MKNHFENNTSGKTPYLLFLGYDGCAADIVAKEFNTENNIMKKLKDNGGAAYLAYTGGEKGAKQTTITAPGWTAMFTGKWGKETGVLDNDSKKTLKPEYHTIMYALEEQNIKSSFSYSWSVHKEVYKYDAEKYPGLFLTQSSDDGTFASMRDRINLNDRAIFGIFEATDSAGHSNGYSYKKQTYLDAYNQLQNYSKQLIEQVEARGSYDSEDWLIVFTTDHGGINNGHGNYSLQETTTFFVSNKKIF